MRWQKGVFAPEEAPILSQHRLFSPCGDDFWGQISPKILLRPRYELWPVSPPGCPCCVDLACPTPQLLCPAAALLRVCSFKQQRCAAGRRPDPGDLPGILLAGPHQLCPASGSPPSPSPAKPASSQGAAPFLMLPQCLCLRLAGTRSPFLTGLFIF